MGTFYHSIEVGDPQGGRFETIEGLVDTGASYSVFPAALLRRLDVPRHARELFTLGDGHQVERDIGRTWVRINGRSVITLAVFGEEGTPVLLGAYTLDGLALGVDPTNRRLVPTPRLLMVNCGKGQPMQAKRMSNRSPTVHGVARLTGRG